VIQRSCKTKKKGGPVKSGGGEKSIEKEDRKRGGKYNVRTYVGEKSSSNWQSLMTGLTYGGGFIPLPARQRADQNRGK